MPSRTQLSDESSTLLRTSRLSVAYASGGGPLAPALRQVDLRIAAGEVVGILGESGCGKSTLALAILGLLPDESLLSGSISFKNQDLLSLGESEFRAIRGSQIALIHQEPGLSLSPVMRVGEQIAEVLHAHGDLSWKECKEESEAILKQVHLPNTERIYSAYPHQLSGGELHRVAIGQALVCRPDLVIADEPTRSLDVTIQAEILNVLREINRKFGTTLLFITHNPALLARFATRVIVMYAGRIVEQGRVSQVYGRPLHPYTKALLQLIPRSSRDSVLSKRHLPVIPGMPPDLKKLGQGCAFEPRCARRTSICQGEDPDELMLEENRAVSCFNHGN